MCVLTEEEHHKKIKKKETKMLDVQHLQEKHGFMANFNICIPSG